MFWEARLEEMRGFALSASFVCLHWSGDDDDEGDEGD